MFTENTIVHHELKWNPDNEGIALREITPINQNINKATSTVVLVAPNPL